MANLLADSDSWLSFPQGSVPPEYWDGSTYFITSLDYPDVVSMGMEYTTVAPANSTLYANIQAFYEDSGTGGPCYFIITFDQDVAFSQEIDGNTTFLVDLVVPVGVVVSVFMATDPLGGNPLYQYSAIINPAQPAVLLPYYVYELDKGWTFDGAYIPHFLELNWYFGDSPTQYHGIQKIRVHGLSKGRSYLAVSLNGMQTDYEPDYTEPQILDLPRNPKVISIDLFPETNYVDTAGRGLSIQMKFEGRNTDIALPEPQHALQVLILQSSPVGTGFDAN